MNMTTGRLKRLAREPRVARAFQPNDLAAFREDEPFRLEVQARHAAWVAVFQRQILPNVIPRSLIWSWKMAGTPFNSANAPSHR